MASSCQSNIVQLYAGPSSGNNLSVTSLYANSEIVGTLIVQGAGNGKKTSENGLCVRTGARIEGRVTIVNDVDIDGSLTVTKDSHFSTVSISDASGLTVGGEPAGPNACALNIARLRTAVVSITDGVNQNMGIAIGKNRILSCAWWSSKDITQFIGETGNIHVIATTDGGEVAYAAAVFSLMPTAGLVVVTVTSAVDPFSVFAELETDVPPAGTHVIIPGGNLTLGSTTYLDGIIENPSSTMYYEYTSVHVSVVQPFTGSTGAPILNDAGKIIGVLQYGTKSSSPPVIYASVAGGVNASFIKYFLDSMTSGTEVALPVACADTTTNSLQARGIGFRERSVAMAAGGTLVAPFAGPVTRNSQVLGLQFNGLMYKTGNLASNLPSFQDLILLSKVNAASEVEIIYAPPETGFTTAMLVGSQLSDESLWSHGSPLKPNCTFVSSQTNLTTQFDATAIPNGFSLTEVKLSCTVISSNIGVLTFGNTTNFSFPNVFVFWGMFAKVALYFSGLPTPIAKYFQDYVTAPPTSYVIGSILTDPSLDYAFWTFSLNEANASDTMRIVVTLEENSWFVYTGPTVRASVIPRPQFQFNTFAFSTNSPMTPFVCSLLSTEEAGSNEVTYVLVDNVVANIEMLKLLPTPVYFS